MHARSSFSNENPETNFVMKICMTDCKDMGGVVASTLASHALGPGFDPGLAQCRLVYQAMIGTASAGKIHSLARRASHSAASSVPRYGVAPMA